MRDGGRKNTRISKYKLFTIAYMRQPETPLYEVAVFVELVGPLEQTDVLEGAESPVRLKHIQHPQGLEMH